MKITEQILIISELLDAARELNGEFQDGWDAEIENGERLLDWLKDLIQ